MAVNQLSIFMENEPGKLSEIIELLRENGIQIYALSIAEVEDFGILRIIVNDTYKGSKVLKEAGHVLKITPMLTFALPQNKNDLAAILLILGDKKINVEYIYTFITQQTDQAYVAMRVNKEDSAIDALQAHGFKPLNQEDLNN